MMKGMSFGSLRFQARRIQLNKESIQILKEDNAIGLTVIDLQGLQGMEI